MQPFPKMNAQQLFRWAMEQNELRNLQKKLVKHTLIGGGVGATVGGLDGAYLNHYKLENGRLHKKEKHPVKDAIKGALFGGLMGAGFGVSTGTSAHIKGIPSRGVDYLKAEHMINNAMEVDAIKREAARVSEELAKAKARKGSINVKGTTLPTLSQLKDKKASSLVETPISRYLGR